MDGKLMVFFGYLAQKKIVPGKLTLTQAEQLVTEFEKVYAKPTPPTTIYARDVPKKIVVDAK